MEFEDLSETSQYGEEGAEKENMILEEPVYEDAPYALNEKNNHLYVTDSIRFYFARVQQFPQLSDKENLELIRKYRKGDLQARDYLVDCNQRIIYRYALKYRRQSNEFMDLIQEGNLGLLKAIDKFEEGHGTKFTTYANYWVFQYITRSLSNKGHMIRLPISGVELFQKIKNLRNEFLQQHDREPSFEELKEQLPSLTRERYLQIMQIIGGVLSLDMKMDEDNESDSFESTIASDEAELDNYLRQQFIKERLNWIMDMISPRLKQILVLRFGLDGGKEMTLQEVGDLLGVSREGARVLEKKALETIAEYINDDFDGYLQELTSSKEGEK